MEMKVEKDDTPMGYIFWGDILADKIGKAPGIILNHLKLMVLARHLSLQKGFWKISK